MLQCLRRGQGLASLWICGWLWHNVKQTSPCRLTAGIVRTCFTSEQKMEKSTMATPSFRRLSPVQSIEWGVRRIERGLLKPLAAGTQITGRHVAYGNQKRQALTTHHR